MSLIGTSHIISKVIKETEEVFNKFKIDADTISRDIRAVEQFLESNAINFEYSFVCYKEKYKPEAVEIALDIADEDDYIVHLLSWAKHPIQPDKYRLYYSTTTQRIFRDTYCDVRPLIETKLPIRKKMHPYLQDFLRSFAEHAKSILTKEQE